MNKPVQPVLSTRAAGTGIKRRREETAFFASIRNIMILTGPSITYAAGVIRLVPYAG
jgi:hypothetical protein